MRVRGIALVVVLFAGSHAARARADEAAPPASPASFGALVQDAVPLARADLAGWAWSLTAKCDQGDDLAQRQCKVVRDARAAQLRGTTFVVDGDAAAFTVGAYDAAKKSIAITLRGCIACAQPLEIAGRKLYVVSNKAAPTETGGVLQAAVVHETARTFKDEASAVAWRTETVPRLKVELVFQLPAGDPQWSRGGKDGLAVSVVGFRVYDPCDGGIVCASPVAEKLDADPKACGTVEQGAADAPPPDGDADAPPPEAPLVDALEPSMISRALAPAVAQAQDCYDTYGVPGTAKMRITIAGDGTIAALEQTGDFTDTPTGACIDKAIKTVTFPKSRKKKTTVNYPIVLR